MKTIGITIIAFFAVCAAFSEPRDERSMTKGERVATHIATQLTHLRATAASGDILFSDKAIHTLEYAERHLGVESESYADLVDEVQTIEDANNEKLKALGIYALRAERSDYVAPTYLPPSGHKRQH